MAGSVIQATGIVKFEDGLRAVVLPDRLIPALPFAEAPKTAEWLLRYMAQLSARCRLTIG